MASSSSTTRMLSLKAILISTGVVSIAMALRFSVPLMLNFAVYELPEIWSLILSWLKPPYLYVVINGIIISIAASSRFQYHSSTTAQSEPLVRPISTPPSDLPPVLTQPALITVLEPPVVYESELPEVLDVEKPVIINGINTVEEESEFVISRSSWNPPARTDSMKHDLTEFVSPVKEKPLVSSRFGHRKPVKSSPEGGRALRVAKPKRQDTLENTWRTITDGRHMPLARHLKKSDTLENHGRQFQVSDPASPHVMRKAETIRDRTNFTNSHVEAVSSPVSSSPGSTGKLRKEASLGQDELNRRVEAFIKKFNEEMRLQRQESLNQYKEMITRGAH